MSEVRAEVTVEDLSPVKKKLVFQIPWEDVKQELESAYRSVGHKVKVKGFRPGKVPRAILETRYRDYVTEETVTSLVNRHYWETLKEKEIASIGQPHIEQQGIEVGKDFNFTATVEVDPVFEPQGYLGLELSREEPSVTDEDVENRLREIRNLYATLEEVSEGREVRKGDYVTIDFEGRLGQEVRKDLKSEGYLLEIGGGMFVPGFEEHLTGMKPGEKKEFPVTFPENYRAKDLAGKEVVFSVVLKNIKEKKLPELNEEFIKNFEKYETLEQLRGEVKASLQEEKKGAAEAALRESIRQAILQNNPFEVPDTLVERQIFSMMADAHRRMMYRGMDEKKATELSIKLHDQFKEEATRIVRTFLLVKRIAAKESIAVSDQELEARIRELAAGSGRSYDDMRASLEKDDLTESVRGEELAKKVFDFIEKNAKVTVSGGPSAGGKT
ncbi:MAG: Trigger factor [Syntrophaceae bacterium PtaU1.Bin231]|nr:MAG: Trigger factor [Syntrophaceae bacterium PtaU1.Bin231]